MPIVSLTKSILRRCHPMRPFTPDLPPELWAMIFNLLLEPMVTVTPYKYCTPDTFSYYRTEQYPTSYRHRDYTTHSFLWDHRTWLQISLVCRAWASLVGTQPFLDISNGQYHLRVGVRSIKCSYPCKYPDNPLELLRKYPQISNGLTTLAITQVDHTGPDHFDGVDALLDNYQAFPMLRSLRIDFSPKGDMPQFWNRLEKGFPNLISLGLTRCPSSSSEKTITFKQLEILIIRAKQYLPSRVLPAFSLPRLQQTVITASHFANSREFLEKHGNQLQFLSFSIDYRWPWSPADFWELLPNLLTLEILAEAAGWFGPSRQGLPPIPPTHPLRRLVLTNLLLDADSDWWEATPAGVEEGCLRRILLTIPTIENLSITETLLTEGKVEAFRRVATECGITFEVHSVTVPASQYQLIREDYRGENLKIAFFSGLHAVIMWAIPLAIALLSAAESMLRYSERLKRGYYKLIGRTPGPLGIY